MLSPLYTFLHSLLAARLRDDRGATAVEYGLMVALIAVAIIGVVVLLGDNLSGLFGEVAAEVDPSATP